MANHNFPALKSSVYGLPPHLRQPLFDALDELEQLTTSREFVFKPVSDSDWLIGFAERSHRVPGRSKGLIALHQLLSQPGTWLVPVNSSQSTILTRGLSIGGRSLAVDRFRKNIEYALENYIREICPQLHQAISEGYERVEHKFRFEPPGNISINTFSNLFPDQSRSTGISLVSPYELP